jgi:alpha-amylase
VKLKFSRQGDTVTLTPPATLYEAPEGDYMLYFVSDNGAPSKAVHVKVKPRSSALQRTVVFIKGETQGGQDMFIRGGIGHDYAAAQLGLNCTEGNKRCAIPIKHRNLRNATTASWKQGDTVLDWYGAEQGQGANAQGTAADWTTNAWHFGDPVRRVATDGFGEEPLNTFGDHYWMMDVDMDCSRTVNGWFELKTFVSNGPGWEPDVAQPGAPYPSTNHLAQCGKLNVFERGKPEARISDLP